MFSNKSAHKQVSIFNETSMNIFPNFVPNKLVTFDNKDTPWMNDCVKSKIKRRNPLCNTYAKNGYKFHDHLHLQEATNLVSEVIAKRKQDYLNNLAIRLNNPATSAKPYCSIFKIFVKVKKFVSFLHFQLTISLFQALKRKQTTLIIFLFHIAPH